MVTVVSLRISMVNFYPRPRHTRERDRNLNPKSIVLGSIFCLQIWPALRLRATPALYRSNAGFSPIWGVVISAEFSDDKLKRHRACPSMKTSVDEPSDVPSHACTLRGTALSSWGTTLSSLVRASRVQGSQWPYGGSRLVQTLYRIFLFLYKIWNRFGKWLKSGDTGIFSLDYGLKRHRLGQGDFIQCNMALGSLGTNGWGCMRNISVGSLSCRRVFGIITLLHILQVLL